MWCILCLGLHHSKENPPTNEDYILPKTLRYLFLLCAAEWPSHPTITWLNAKQIMLMKAMLERHPMMNVNETTKKKNVYSPQFGLKYCSTFL